MSDVSVEKKGFADGFWSDEEIKTIFLEKQREIIWNKDYWKNVLVPLFKLRQDSTILDVGCGLGFLGRNLAEFNLNGKTIGIDLDAKLIDAARKIAKFSLPNHSFDFRVGNAYELPIDDDSVDLAICQCVLMHLEDSMKAFLK